MTKFSSWLDQHKQEFMADFAQLIAIDSVSTSGDQAETIFGPACAKCQDFLGELADRYGLEIRHDAGYYSLLTTGQAADKRLGLFCHADVVPAGEGWTFEPYALSNREGYLIGRGVGDNKGALLVSLYLLRYLKDNPLTNYQVELFAGFNEEAGMKDIAHYVDRNAEPDISLVPDVSYPVCVGEKSRLVVTLTKQLTVASDYGLQAGVADNVIPQKCCLLDKDQHIVEEFMGQGGHAAFPVVGSNAVEVALEHMLTGKLQTDLDPEWLAESLKLVQDIHGTYTGLDYQDENGQRTTFVCTQYSWQTDGQLSLTFDCRFSSALSPEEVTQRLQAFADQRGFNLSVLKESPSVNKPIDWELVKALTAISNHVTGQDKEPYFMGGGTYARFLEKGLCFGIGLDAPQPDFIKPGTGGAHQADECIPVEQIWQGFQSLFEALQWIDTNR